MTTRPARVALVAVSGLMLLAVAEVAAQSASRTYKDSRGKAIVFPLGDASFADDVRAFLVSQPGLKGRSIAARGFGAATPVAPNTNEEGRAKNRRVELVISPQP